jgi:hypothetical protein
MLACSLLGWQWHRSYRTVDAAAVFLRHGCAQLVMAESGTVSLIFSNLPVKDSAWSILWASAQASHFDSAREQYRDPNEFRRAGGRFAIAHGSVEPTETGAAYFALTVPHWSLLVAAILPSLPPALKWRRSRQRLRRGLCVHCGYDLRASSSICPECGTPVGSGVVAARES